MKRQKILLNKAEYQGLVKPPELDKLAKSINERAKTMSQRNKTNLQDAIAQGAELVRVKELLPKRSGEFGSWCRINVEGTCAETIRLWMRLHKYQHLLTENGATPVLTINQAELVIRKHVASLKPRKDKPKTETVKLSEIAINKAKELLPLLNNRMGSPRFKNIEQVIEYTINREWSQFHSESFNHFVEMQETQAQA